MTKKEMISKLEGNSFIISAKTFDSDFEFALIMVKDWACESYNTCDEEYVSKFEEEGMLEYCFTEYGYSVVGGVTHQEIANQPNWWEESYDDLDEDQLEELVKQLN